LFLCQSLENAFRRPWKFIAEINVRPPLCVTEVERGVGLNLKVSPQLRVLLLHRLELLSMVRKVDLKQDKVLLSGREAVESLRTFSIPVCTVNGFPARSAMSSGMALMSKAPSPLIPVRETV